MRSSYDNLMRRSGLTARAGDAMLLGGTEQPARGEERSGTRVQRGQAVLVIALGAVFSETAIEHRA